MLEDYALATGVAGRWRRVDGKWNLEPGRAFASPRLTPRDRKHLRTTAVRWLTEGAPPGEPYEIIGMSEPSGDAAFVCVVNFNIPSQSIAS
jgi:hypothetical protein